MEQIRPSSIAWGTIIAGVVAYEYFSPKGETLSERIDPLLESPVKRALTCGFIGMTALHLCNMLPKDKDPYHLLTRIKDKDY